MHAYLSIVRCEGGVKAPLVEKNELIYSIIRELLNTSTLIHYATSLQGHALQGRELELKLVLKHIISNAMDNCNTVSENVENTPRKLEEGVDDVGPGIPSNMCEEVLKEFYRWDGSIHQDKGGLCLELSMGKVVLTLNLGHIHIGVSPI